MSGRTTLSALIAAAMMTTTLAAAGVVPADAAPRKDVYIPKVQQEKVLPHDVQRDGDVPAWRPSGTRKPASGPRTRLPGGAAVTVDVPASGGAARLVKAGALPVSVGPPRGAQGARAGAPRQVEVRLLDKEAGKAHINGVAVGLRAVGDDARVASGAATVAVDYGTFSEAIGAGWANRLRLVRYPACVLTTPDEPGCRKAEEVPSVNDAKAQTLTAQVPLAGASTARTTAQPMTVLAATAAPSGSTGDFTATSLSPSGSWAQGGATGGFSWNYPLVLPPPGTGAAPPLTLSYDSQAVDGQNTTSNNQASWVGQGWSYDAGYIERTYRTCSDDKSLPDEKETGDLCWAGPIVTINMPGGATGSLVQDDTTKEWHVEAENGVRIELKTGADNGAWHGEHWVVTTRDGTRHFFGLNRLPGSTADDATDSAWTVPVFSPRADDPCYDAAGFGQSRCNMAYRWNLDYSVDVDGNATTYGYQVERNFYSSTAGAGDPNRLGYDRGGHLKSVKYGLNTAGAGLFGDPAPQRILFGTAERCFPSGDFTCSDADFKVENAVHWPDVPVDQACKDSGTCDNHSPTFWSRERLTAISTSYWGGGAYHDVDRYELGQSFSDLSDGELLLDSVTRISGEGADQLTAPPVRFSMATKANRVEGLHTLPGMYRSRLHTIFTETGQNISIAYSGDDGQAGRAKPLCTASTIPSAPSSNTTECYPVKWKPPYSENDILDYFHKYVVTEVTVSDNNATAPSRISAYYYVGNPAWHYDDNEVQRPKHRTWSQFRGYAQVETRTGNPNVTSNGKADAWTSSKSFYYRGMDGDRLPNNGARSETITDSQGAAHPDKDGLAGQILEAQQLDGVGGALVSKTIYFPKIIRTTATRVRDGDLDPVKAQIIRPASSTTYTAKAAGGFLTAGTATVYDNDGRATEVTSTASSATASCVRTTYVDNESKWVKDKASEVVTYETTCPSTATPSPKVLRKVRTYYDGSDTLGTMTEGKPTRTESFKTTSASVTTRTTYDAYGRVRTSTTDNPGATPAVRTTTTTYTPAGVGALTRVDTQLPLATHATRRYLDPARGVATKSVAVDGLVTEGEFDSFGRLTKVWRPGQVKGTDPATETYQYDLRPDAPLVVTTKTLVDRGNGLAPTYKTRIVLFDAFGDIRQAQADAVGGGRVVTDNFTDSHGWSVKANDHWYTTGAPDDQVVTTAQSGIDDWKTTTYDGTGRPTLVSSMRGASTVTATIKTIYGGDRTTVIQPTGGVSNTSIVDGRGNQIELDQYKTLPTVSGNSVTGGTFQRQTFAFDGIGQQTQMKTAAGVTGKEATWTNSYDLLGRVTSAVSPDSGDIRSDYYDTGELKTQTDGANRVIAYDYDAVGRPLNRYTGSVGGPKVASWSYDDPSLGVGRPASSTSYENSSSYTKSVSGYDAAGRATGETVSLSVAGFNASYTTEQTWTSTGQRATQTLASTLNSAGGGLSPEKLTYSYDELGNAIGLQGQNAYVSGATYTPYGEPAQYVFGVNDQTTVYSIERDAKTRRITDLTLSGQLAAPQLEKTSYSYDAAGNVVKSVNQQGSAATGPIQTQCFQYDGLRQLVNAWSATDACATNPSVTKTNAKVGGQQPYWTTWAYDDAGNRTSQVKHGLGTATDTTTTYTMNTPGHPHALTSTSAGASYAYNGDGAMSKRTVGTATTSFGYDADGSLDTVATPSGASTYVQDPDGNILLRTDPTTTTLYLPGQEVVVTTASQAVSVHKYYEFNGTNIGVRIHKGAVRYMVADLNGTNQVAVDPANGFAVTRRYLDPFGNLLANKAGAPAPGTLPGNHGFLNAPLNATTGLVDMGARQYESATGRFTSVDPVLTPNDPQQAQGYMYASNNPVMFSDRSGLMLLDGGGGGGSATPRNPYTAPPAPEPPSFAKGFMDGAGAGSRDLIDSLNPKNIFDGIKSLITKPPNPFSFIKTVVKGLTHFDDFKGALEAWKDGDEEKAGYYVGKLVVEISGDLLMTVLGTKAAEALGDALKAGTTAADVTEEASSIAKATATTTTTSCLLHSFSGSTQVTMANGKRKPIRDVKIGDLVRTVHPATGRIHARKVTRVWVHSDLLELARVGSTTIRTTRDHPFWNASDQRFEELGSFDPGDAALVEASVGTYRGFVADSAAVGIAYNLTVEREHNYLVGPSGILVHNCGGGWKLGDDVFSPTKAGNDPAWSTVRSRFWKNEANEPMAGDQYGATNVDRMKKGLAPRRYNRQKGGWESMELSHEPVPFRLGGQSVTPRWPQEHALFDPYRYVNY